MILVIDNYDSFTYNLVQYIRQIGEEVIIFRNDAVNLATIRELDPDGIVISPGPGTPDTAGISMDVINEFSGKKPILGVCLGHQSIAACFGGKIISAKQIMHGKTSTITADGMGVYTGIKKPFPVMRYHSLAVCPDNLPHCLEITSRSKDGEIMGLRHREHMTEGIQFHPESIMTPVGKRLLRNFVKTTHKEEA